MSVDIKAPRNKISSTGSDTVTGTTLSSYINATISSVEAFSGATTKYNITNSEDIANVHKSLSVKVTGCANPENNGTFIVMDVSDVLGDKYMVLGNGAGVVETTPPSGAVCSLDLTLHAMHVLPLSSSETEFDVEMSLSGGGASGRVTVTQSATAIPSAGLLDRKTFVVYNNGDNPIDLGWDSSISFGNHMVLIAGASLTIDITEDLTLYGIAGAGLTSEVTYMEVS